MGDALPAVDLGSGRTAVAVNVGDDHACAILDNGDVKCWGENDDGQLGLGDVVVRGDGPGEMGDALPDVDLGTGRTAVAIDAAYEHTCALLDNGDLKCWGDGEYGQLGTEDSANVGTGPGEMGDNLPAIDVGTGRSIDVLTTTSYNTCVLLDNNDVKCWGYNSHAQLGTGNHTEHLGDEPGEMGDDLPYVGIDGRVRPIQVPCPTSPHHGFVDVDASSYVDEHATCMKELAITQGTGDGTTYSPGDYVNREQMAAFIGRMVTANLAAA